MCFLLMISFFGILLLYFLWVIGYWVWNIYFEGGVNGDGNLFLSIICGCDFFNFGLGIGIVEISVWV